jgi:nucleoside-diphosphate-sugar epimerase
VDREIEVAIAGAHGKVARLLGALLVEQGHSVLGLIRNPAQEDDLHAIGVEPVICDLEADHDAGEAVAGADAIVFAAGAGPGSGAERKRTMDLGGALRLIEAARETGIRRYVMVSAMGAAGPPASGGGVFGEYLRAKAAADEALRGSGLDYTIVRPGGLTDAPGTGRVAIAARLERGEVPRADVAAVLAAVLLAPNAVGREFDLLAGQTPVAQALAAL